MPKEMNNKIRQRILQSALEEFSNLGFDGSTVRGIAARGGVTHGMIRYYYETKEKLWFEAVTFLFARLDSFVRLSAAEEEALADGNIDVFREMLRRYVQYCAQHPEHARIMMQETVAPSERTIIALTENLRAPHQRLKSVIENLQKQGVFSSNAPAESIIYMITGACQNLFALAPEVHTTLDYDALCENAINAHADLIVSTFCPD